MKRIIAGVLALGFAVGAVAQSSGQRLFSSGWEFSRDSLATTKTINLPHDFSMERAGETDNEEHIGPFSSQSQGGRSSGYVLGGTGWYRKYLVVSEADEGKTFTLTFGCAYMEADVLVNGKLLASHKHGYTPFRVDITPALKGAGQSNEIVVKVRNFGRNTRWYSGSGIYRDVFLTVSNPLHVEEWGVYVTTPEVSKESARIDLVATAVNSAEKRADATVAVSLFDKEGKEIASDRSSLRLDGNSKADRSFSFVLQDPKLWNVDHPYLYTSVVKILDSKGKELDSYTQKFGVRSIECDAVNGLRINGESVLLRGGCVHHDNGLLGGASYRAAEYRKVRLLKESGYNAVRCAHNPPSKYFLEACDELGMYVMDEFMDQWEQPKNADDYAQFFVENWEKDLTDMILSDRNHPSVILWSIGNEIPNWSIADASRIGKQLSDKVRELDPTRLVTQGITGAYIHLEWDNSQYTFQHLDAAGYNYLPNHYEEDHAKFPERVIVGTESYPAQSFRYWKDVVEKPYVIGDFIWTAMDYLGEVGLGSSRYVQDNPDQPQRQMPMFQNSMGPKENQNPAMMWAGGGGNAGAAGSMPRFQGPKMPTSFVSWCGDIDIIGDIKPQGRYRRVMWDVTDIDMVVHEPIPAGMKEMLGQWAWPKEQASWYWPGHEGEGLQVRVFTKAPKVRLQVNGETVAEKEVNEEYIALFENVIYKPGKIVAISLDENGKELQSKVIRTPGKPYAVRVLRDRYNVYNDLAYLKLEVIDKEGVVIPSEFPLSFDIKGASFVTAGNGSIDGMESFGSLTPKTYLGSALLIVRPDSEDSRVDITVKSPGLQDGKAIFTGKGEDILSKNLGVGLCSVIGMGADFEDSVRRIAQTGATYVELNNGVMMFGVSPEEAKAVFDKYGLRVISDVTMASMIDVDNVDSYLQRWEQTFKQDALMGVKYVAMTANMCWGTEPHALKCCEVLNKIGALAKKYGIQFLYHLHNIEMNPILDSDYKGQIVDFIAENTDPDLVKFEDDVFWVEIGGRDTVEFLRKYADRIPMLHVKDFYYIGEGDYLDYKAIFGQFFALGGKDWVLEMEDPMTRQQMYEKAEGHNRMSQTREPAPGQNQGGFAPRGGQRTQPSAEELAVRLKSQEKSRLRALRDIEINMRTLEGLPFLPSIELK
ncbi:MAG: TIM barrel protein [Bacteroidales bacterium]|nr:TIM barrel protein [Bacteroidales bacterium]